MEIELKITKDSLDNLTWGDWEAIESGVINHKEARRIIALFMVDPDGNPILHETGMETLKQLKTGEMRKVTSDFTAALTRLTKELVPNSNGGG